MVTYAGYNTVVVHGAESAYGTGDAPSTVINGRLQNVTIDKNNNIGRVGGMGEGRNEQFQHYGNFSGQYSINYDVGDFGFLEYGIGLKAGEGTTAAPFTLEEKDFIDYTSGIKSFGMIVNSLDSTTHDKELLSGCIMDKIGLTFELGLPLKAAISGFFKTTLNSTDTTAFTKNTTKPWIFSQGSFKWNSGPIALVSSGSIKIDNKYVEDDGRGLGSRFVEAVAPGMRSYDFTIVVKMTDTIATTLRDHFYGKVNTPDDGIADAEPTPYEFALEFAEGSAATDRVANIEMSNASINDISKPINLEDGMVVLTINGQAKHGKTATTNKPFTWWTITA